MEDEKQPTKNIDLIEMVEATRSGEISKEAKKFIENSSGATWETVDLTPKGVEILRIENSEVAAPGCLRVQTKLGVTTEEGLEGDVPVQWVNPAHISGTEVIFYLFGGGFVCGSPEDDLSITATLATRMGRRVCVPRYRLAPEHPYPAARTDVLEVYRSLCLRQAAKIVVVGQSAGGNLALGLVLQVTNEGVLPAPSAVALLSPWIDLTHSGHSHLVVNLDPTLSVEHFLQPAARAYAAHHCTRLPGISPLFAVTDPPTLSTHPPSHFPPTTISSGTKDCLLSDCQRLADRLLEHYPRVCVDLQITRGLWHVYEWYPQLPEADQSLRHIAHFLLDHM